MTEQPGHDITLKILFWLPVVFAAQTKGIGTRVHVGMGGGCVAKERRDLAYNGQLFPYLTIHHIPLNLPIVVPCEWPT